jgi:uncharacterized protein with FMN-binding domain
MRRAFPAVIITAVGLGALASFHATPAGPVKSAGAALVPGSTAPATAAPPDPGPTTRTPTTQPPTTQTGPTQTGPTQTGPTQTGPTQTPTTGGATRTLTGDPFDNRYGTVQVQVTLQGNTITGVTTLQMPNSHQRSVEISQQAEPLLLQEVLQAQSAQIDILSGATYTSQSYAQSLQSALDKSGA